MTSKSTLIIVLILAIIGGAIFVGLNGVDLFGLKVEPVETAMKLGLDIQGGVTLVYEAETDETGDDLIRTMDQTVLVLSRRIDALGLVEPKITVVNEKRIRIELPGVEDTQEAIKMIGQTAQLEFRYVAADAPVRALPGMTLDMFESEPVITGSQVKDAFGTFDSQQSKYVVSLKFDSEGKTLFKEATEKAVNSPAGYAYIAIVLDEEVISAPQVDVIIADGSAVISGNFTMDEVINLGHLIKGGALPVKLEEIQTSVIGPTLGKDALSASLNAAAVGFILVALFMIFYYRVPGLLAVIALMLYGCIVIFAMIGFNATLTLPGVAGMVLSVGMAVDANVIIFERLREELRNGKTVRSAVSGSFKRAMKTIIDSNVTTFIAALVLFYFGEGPIKGFAVTLMIGIAASMFTAVTVTHTLVNQCVNVGLLKNRKLIKG